MYNGWLLFWVFVLFCACILWWFERKIRAFDQVREDMLESTRTNEAWREVILNNRRSTDRKSDG